MIEPNGTVLRYRMDTEEGAHTLKENRRSIGICLTGNFDVEMPTSQQIEALRGILGQMRGSYGLLPIYPHRKFAVKSCYGSLLPDGWAAKLLDPPPADTAKEELFEKYNPILEQMRQVLLKLQAYIRR